MADRRLRLIYAIVAVMALVWPVLIFTAPLYISDKTELNIAVRLYYDIAYVILLLAFSSILLYLLLTLRKLPEFFKKEQRHIFRQFLVYWSSFLIKIVIQVLIILDSVKEWSDFTRIMLMLTSYVLANIVPI